MKNSVMGQFRILSEKFLTFCKKTSTGLWKRQTTSPKKQNKICFRNFSARKSFSTYVKKFSLGFLELHSTCLVDQFVEKHCKKNDWLPKTFRQWCENRNLSVQRTKFGFLLKTVLELHGSFIQLLSKSLFLDLWELESTWPVEQFDAKQPQRPFFGFSVKNLLLCRKNFDRDVKSAIYQSRETKYVFFWNFSQTTWKFVSDFCQKVI